MTSASRYLCRVYFCILALVGNCLWAQDPHPTFKQYDVEDGLASSRVYQVKQDSKGYIWFATDNGVSRFNGYEFENFSMSNGLPDNTVFEIFEDLKGRIWFLSLSNKIVYYDKGRMHLYQYNDVIGDNIKKRHVKTSFYVTENGSVFLGLTDNGIFEITEKGEMKVHFSQDPAGPSGKVIEPEKGHYIYCNNLLSQKTSLVEFQTSTVHDTIELESRFRFLDAAARIIKLKNNKLAVCAGNTLSLIDSSGGITKQVFDKRMQWLYEDNDRDLWIGTYLGGVYLVHNEDFKNKKCYLDGLSVTCVTQDTEKGLWFTTEGNSVYYAPSKFVLTYDHTSGLEDARVKCLASDSQGIFLGLQNAFIHKLTRSGTIIPLNRKGFRSDITRLYYNDRTSELFYSAFAESGVVKNGKVKERIHCRFYKIIPENNNRYWLINNYGLFRLVDFKIEHSNRKFKRMNSLIRKDKNTLLTGAMDGLWEYNIPGNSYKYLGKKHPLLQNRIIDLAYMKDSTLLIATKGVGLLVLYRNGRLEQLTISKGLSSDNITKILIDSSFVWLATDKGLNRITIGKQGFEKNRIRIFTTYDGLVSDEINDIHLFNDHLWVATDKGLSFFSPGLPDAVPYELPVYINQVMINDSATLPRTKYSLGHFENNIKIGFIALAYKNAKRLQYRYRMVGLDTSWAYTRNRDIQYTTLPPGNYRFIVSALNANRQWSRSIIIDFHISTPFYKTWWFFFLSLLCLIALIFYILRAIFKRKQEKKSKSEEINRVLLQLKLKALRAQMNPHFIFNVMSSIQHFILFKNNDAAHHYLSKFAKLVRTILNNSEKNMIPLSDEIKALTLYLDLENMRLETYFEYDIQLEESLDMNRIEIPSMLIQPYVENAVKHGILPSKKAGNIKITIIRHQEFLKCTIEDNGVGRAFSLENKSSDYRSFGTAITKERLAVINELYHNRLSEQVTDLYDEEKVPIGTKVEIYIPFNQN